MSNDPEKLSRPEAYFPTIDTSESAQQKEAGIRAVRSLVTDLKRRDTPEDHPVWGHAKRLAEQCGMDPNDFKALLYSDAEPEPEAAALDPNLGPKRWYKLTLVARTGVPEIISEDEAREGFGQLAKQMGLELESLEPCDEPAHPQLTIEEAAAALKER